MKKSTKLDLQAIFGLFAIFLIFSTTTSAAVTDTKNWYLYNGYSAQHDFSIRFPPYWQAKISNDQLQSFSPKDNSDSTPPFSMEEFEGLSYDQVISNYSDDNNIFVSAKDQLLQTISEDIITKEVTYLNKTGNRQLTKTLIKRGSLIISLNKNSTSYTDILEGIQNSFKFNDKWHQYIDLTNGFSFVYPSNFNLKKLDNGLEITPRNKQNSIFNLSKYENVTIDNVAKAAATDNLELDSQQVMDFHGIKAIEAVYLNKKESKKLALVFVEKNSNSYGLSTTNQEDNFPHNNYYDENVAEILTGFEFIDLIIDPTYSSFQFFPDIRDNHLNSTAINTLTNEKIIAGYPDGTFKPDGEINRAELTKMIVASKAIPDATQYQNCFSDVADQWFAAYICYAKEQGWVSGYADNKFKPDAKISRVEAMKIILEALFHGKISDTEALQDQTVQNVKSQDWYYKYYVFADNRKLLDKQHVEEAKYLPTKNITRKEVAEMIYRSEKL